VRMICICICVCRDGALLHYKEPPEAPGGAPFGAFLPLPSPNPNPNPNPNRPLSSASPNQSAHCSKPSTLHYGVSPCTYMKANIYMNACITAARIHTHAHLGVAPLWSPPAREPRWPAARHAPAPALRVAPHTEGPAGPLRLENERLDACIDTYIDIGYVQTYMCCYSH
jgi:hypothetical protein